MNVAVNIDRHGRNCHEPGRYQGNVCRSVSLLLFEESEHLVSLYSAETRGIVSKKEVPWMLIFNSTHVSCVNFPRKVQNFCPIGIKFLKSL